MRLLLLIFHLYLATETGLTLYFTGVLTFADTQLSFHAWKSLLIKTHQTEYQLL